MSLRVISGFNYAERFRWQAGVWAAVVCVHICLYVCMQSDTFVLRVLHIPSQNHRHFGNRVVKDICDRKQRM